MARLHDPGFRLEPGPVNRPSLRAGSKPVARRRPKRSQSAAADTASARPHQKSRPPCLRRYCASRPHYPSSCCRAATSPLARHLSHRGDHSRSASEAPATATPRKRRSAGTARKGHPRALEAAPTAIPDQQKRPAARGRIRGVWRPRRRLLRATGPPPQAWASRHPTSRDSRQGGSTRDRQPGGGTPGRGTSTTLTSACAMAEVRERNKDGRRDGRRGDIAADTRAQSRPSRCVHRPPKAADVDPIHHSQHWRTEKSAGEQAREP